jgi:hypothetical protein
MFVNYIDDTVQAEFCSVGHDRSLGITLAPAPRTIKY